MTSLHPNQWGLLAIGAPGAWELGWGCSDVVIAVVDGGCHIDHPDLNHRLRAHPNGDGVTIVVDEISGDDPLHVVVDPLGSSSENPYLTDPTPVTAWKRPSLMR